MVMMFIDEQVKEKCWNLIDSYGEICVHCGCCSKDKRERYIARISALENWLEERLNFDMWSDDPKLRAVQERNVKKDIRSYKRMLRYYWDKLRDIDYGA